MSINFSAHKNDDFILGDSNFNIIYNGKLLLYQKPNERF